MINSGHRKSLGEGRKGLEKERSYAILLKEKFQWLAKAAKWQSSDRVGGCEKVEAIRNRRTSR